MCFVDGGAVTGVARGCITGGGGGGGGGGGIPPLVRVAEVGNGGGGGTPEIGIVGGAMGLGCITGSFTIGVEVAGEVMDDRGVMGVMVAEDAVVFNETEVDVEREVGLWNGNSELEVSS